MSSAAVHENISAPSAGPAAAQGPAGQPNAASIASPALGKQAATATPGGQQDWAIYNQYASLIGGATWCLWMVMIFCTIALMKRYSKKSKSAKSAVFVAPGEEEEQIEYVQRGYRQTNAGRFVWHFWTKFMVQLCFVELGFFYRHTSVWRQISLGSGTRDLREASVWLPPDALHLQLHAFDACAVSMGPQNYDHGTL